VPFSPTDPSYQGTTHPETTKAPGPQRSGLTSFGRYQHLEELPPSGMGVVYKGRDPVLNIDVAIKTLQPATPDAVLTERFEQEFRVLARLDHPHIVRICDAGRHDAVPYFAMPFMPGGSLDRQMARFGEPRAAATLVEKVARAIHYVHQHGILHRDLKPANVLLDEQDEPRVTDFGLAKFRDGEVAITQPGAVLGTPAYMAPEQARGQGEQVGPATDVWALGVILYELLTARRPFNASRPAAVASLICTTEPARPRVLRPELEPSLEVVVLKCLEKEPRARYSSAAALAGDLALWLAGEPIRAKPPSLRQRLARLARRHPALSTAAVLLAAFLCLLPLLLGRGDPGEQLRREREQQALKTLHSVQGGLDRAETVPLVPLLGDGRKYYRRVGNPDPYTVNGAPDVLGLKNFRVGALDLLPERPREGYRFSAEVNVRLTATRGGTNAGIYVAATEWPAPEGGTEQWFLSLSFPDSGKVGTVLCELHRYFAPAGIIDPDHTHLFVRRELPETQPNLDTWRQLRFDVTPKGILPSWEGKVIGTLTNEYFEIGLRSLARQTPVAAGHPSAEQMLRGALGLYNRNADSQFRNVVVEPLP
jgi:serine/threonine-protein kinase